ncbi:MAG: hypothetical protein Lokiarch_08060 [Candidatus Lokiarchaeum sp. GC14_75]|nr:MAG: hypothetical protein Lokiarch_08060 [Candidatus Lokiarchaeum sp. GC14_75]
MHNSKYRKNKRIFILFLITTTIGLLTFSQILWNSNNFLPNAKTYSEFELLNRLKTSDYSSDFSSAGENMNIILHQSYLNNSYNTDLNPSDTNNNSFIIPSPTDISYNSSFVNFTIQDIYAPNKTQDLELDIDDGATAFGLTTYAFSFDVPSKSVLKEFEICLSGNLGTANAGVGFQIWNATWTGSVIDPDANTGLLSQTETVFTTDAKAWHKISPNAELDPANTDNGTYFIVMWNTNVPTSFPQFNAKNDGVGTYESLVRFIPVATWQDYGSEICSNVTLVLNDNTPKPTEINLEIDGSDVSDDLSGENIGNWISFTEYSSASGELNFTIQADWWDVTVSISEVLINFTKTDLVASSEFNIAGSGQTVEWNVTRDGGLNYFYSGFDNYQINFTIPEAWTNTSIRVFNGESDERTSSITKRLLGNNYREINVPNAGNGTFWFLNATSDNEIASIETIPTNIFNYSDIVYFNATFLNYTNNGIINLSVYSPIAINNRLNYTFTNISFGAGLEVYFGDWDISENVTKYGIFRWQVAWNNDTSAGFRESTIIINADTSLEILYPVQNVNYDASKIFNMTVRYNDTGQNLNISDADIQYKINDGAYSTINENVTYIGYSKYNITFDCNNTFNYGLNNITIKANDTYYNSQTETLDITIWGETSATFDKDPVQAVYDSGELLNISVYYEDIIKNVGISGADLYIFVNSRSNPYSTTIYDYGDGNYNITIDFTDTIFNGYGPFNLIVDVNKTNYYNQTSPLISIDILGETTATFDKDPVQTVYDSGDALNISVYYEDSIKNAGISGADLYIFVNSRSNPYSTTIYDYGDGNYNITIDFTDSIFNGYGPFNLIVDVNKTNYYNQTSTLISIDILSETTATFDKDPLQVVYDSGDALNISVYYEDSIKNVGISGADIYIFVNSRSNPYSTTIYDYGDGNYNITIDFTDSIFNGYGPFNLIVDVNKTNYYNKTSTLINIDILGETTATFDKDPIQAVYDSGDALNISVYYEDSIKSLILSGADLYIFVNTRSNPYSTTIYDYGDGNYNITIDFTDSIFNGYGPFNLIIDVNKTNYYNQTSTLISIDILGETSATFDKDPVQAVYDSGDPLNISVYYEDSIRTAGISGANLYIFVNTRSNPYSTTIYDYGDGNYNITIDFTDSIFNGYGPFNLIVDINKTNYYNQTSPLISIDILGETTATFDKVPLQAVYDSGDALNISVYYEDSIRTAGISGADLYIFVNTRSNPYSTTIYDYGDGNYNITIDFSDTIFNGYGPFNLIVDVNKTYYYNQTSTLISIDILGEITATFDRVPLQAVYDSGDALNISVYYEDSIKSLILSGADLYIFVNSRSNPYSTTIYDYGDGNYNITIDFTDSIFNGYGPFNLIIDVNKTNYYNQTSTPISINIRGETVVTFTKVPDQTNFNSGDSFAVHVQHNDSVKGSSMSDGVITVWVDNDDYTLNASIPYFFAGEYWEVNFDFKDWEFRGYGWFTIKVEINKTYYYNGTTSFNIYVGGPTTATFVKEPVQAIYDSGDTLNISVYYEDASLFTGISGANLAIFVNNRSNPYSTTIFDYGDGNYNITIDFTDTIFNGYGSFNLIIDVNKTNYYNQTSTLISIEIRGETTPTFDKKPDKFVYNSGDALNISVYYEDTLRSLGISGADLVIFVNSRSNPYSTTIYDYGDGNYNITINFTDNIFNGYGIFDLIVDVNKTYYYNGTQSYNIRVLGVTSFNLLRPNNYSSYMDGVSFNITVQFNDDAKSIPINGIINYSIDGSAYSTSYNIYSIGIGKYNITINVNGDNFTNYGYVDIIININKTNYYNKTIVFRLERQIGTSISPSNSNTLPDVYRGQTILFTFNYSDILGNPIMSANSSSISSDYGLSPTLANKGNGNYTMQLYTISVDIGIYNYIFDISSLGNETQRITLTFTVLPTTTGISNVVSISILARHIGANQTVSFTYMDTVRSLGISSLTTANILVYDETGQNSTLWQRGTQDHNWTLVNLGGGNYELRVSTSGLNVGTYTLKFQIINLTNYDDAESQEISFYLRGYYSTFGLISLADEGGQLFSNDSLYNYSSYVRNNLNIRFNLTNTDLGGLVLEHMDVYDIMYINLNTNATGTILNSISYNSVNGTYGYFIGMLNLNQVNLTTGYYQFNMLIMKTNFENVTFSFYLILQDRYDVNISVYSIPDELNAGESFRITLDISIILNSPTQPLIGATISIISIINGEFSIAILNTTNGQGFVSFDITLPSNTKNLSLLVSLDGEYNYNQASIELAGLSVNPPKTTGIPFETIVFSLIFAGIAISVSLISIGVYKGVIVPKKREKNRILTEVKTTFDDAINLEHVLVLYKGTGTCVYFKSFGSDEIDPELISGFISAICSFGKDLASQDTLNEITYGDKMLLLSDGEYIRVTLVLGKKPSNILRKNLQDFVNIFERTYAEELPNWRGQLNIFRGAGEIIDEIMNTSIILPHEITYEFSNAKALKNANSREVLKTANKLIKKSERKFFFIATLLKEASEETHKDTAEIFMGIKELRDKKILKPMEIATIVTQPISQQEIDLLTQKISGLVSNLTQEEKQKLLNDLAQLGPVQREAYLVSLTEQREIISAPIEEKPGAAIINKLKGAKKEIANLKKIAKQARKDKDYTKSLNIYQNATKLASNWELSRELEQLNEYFRLTKIEDLEIKLKTLEHEAKLAAKEENYNEATQKYKISSKIASEIFKLGGTDMTKEVKRLSNKSKEYEKLI